MAELAYATDLKSVPFGVEGSSPSARTNITQENRAQVMAFVADSIAVKALAVIDLSLRQDQLMRRSEAASWPAGQNKLSTEQLGSWRNTVFSHVNQGTGAMVLGLDWLRWQIKCLGSAFVMPRGRHHRRDWRER